MATLMARPRPARRARVGSPKKIVRSARATRAMAIPPTRGTVKLSSRVVGTDSTSAHSRVTGTTTTRIQGDAAALGGISSVQTDKSAAASPPKTTNAVNPAQPLRAFQGSRGPPTAWPTIEAIPSPTASRAHTAATIHRSSRRTSTSASTLKG